MTSFAPEKDLEEKYRDRNFYNNIPIFKSWNDYTLEEIRPGCKIPVTRVEDVHELINYLKNNPKNIYRGHENPCWTLSSTLHRKYINGFPKKEELDAYIKQFRDALIIEAEKSKDKKLHINAEYQLTIEDLKILELQSLWELGQHYGLYTEYLDWTYNIYKALFFTFEPEQWSKPFPYRVLYVLDRTLPNIISNTIDIIPPQIANNLRMKNQEGTFTKITVNKTFEEIISDNLKISDTHFRKIYLLNTKRKSFLKDLQSQKINYQELFTGLEGLIRHCNSLISTRAYGGGIVCEFLQQVIKSPKER